MAGSRIKGITVEIGGDVTGLEKALKSVNTTIKQTQSQLKDVERLLKIDPSNTELLAQKQEKLKDAVSATKEKLDALVRELPWLGARRGKGFMQGLVVTGRPVGEVVQAALGKGLLIISAGSDVLRLVPPLIITEKEIDRLCDILRTL